MTPEDFRRIALALPGAVENAHLGTADFRLGKRIFATIGYPDADWAMVKLTPEHQDMLLHTEPGVFKAASGAWGRQGCTLVRLALADEAMLTGALTAACELLRGKPVGRPRRGG